MVYSKNLQETNPSIPTKPLPEGKVYNMADLMPSTPLSALPQDPMTARHKGKEKEIPFESIRYQPLMANHRQHNHHETPNYTEMNPDNRFEALHPTSTVPVHSFAYALYFYRRVVPNNGLPSPGGEIFAMSAQFPTMEPHVPMQTMVANPPIASTSAAPLDSHFDPSTALPYEFLANYIESIFFNYHGFYEYYVNRPNSLLLPAVPIPMPNMSNKANRAMESSTVQINQPLAPEHQIIEEPSIVHTTNTSPQLSVTRSTAASQSHDNLRAVTQAHSTTKAITTLHGHYDIKEEAELQQSPSFPMRAPELSRSQSIGMDDLSPHYDQEMSGDDDSNDYADTEDLLVPDASITELNVGLDLTPIEQGVRFPGDQYTPVWVRFQGRRRQGRCEQCVHLNRKILWFKLRTSQYLYHKLNAHGIIHATGRPFNKPIDVRMNVDGTREGWCHVCNTYQMAYTPRGRPPMSRWAPWYRHVYTVM
ncbi:hypothetical protein K450DRAFT_271320 [Umbelopsis ramanniana AG]|uniref:Transcription regulator Rua1 C-terminal domain-containing protein n=1 Tax=Umbelopsis ramanniana AG TaxID=1314678 RepID=A0AAD5HDF0_UMBRA|nr:uncharacterized protein K450DRAFT_271320 [Umbelopsis ramanniana AG]KAI8580215.1 hypothetical protein K450DRAFT_271320 [Umbelopsis ramanniana AG]